MARDHHEQLAVGVLVLVFGSQAVLSETNLKGKLWGLGAPGRWWKRRQSEAAERELSETMQLREEVSLQHRYIVALTASMRSLEIWAADKGYTLPPPPFQTYLEWKEEEDKNT